jgi:hypothetical protein
MNPSPAPPTTSSPSPALAPPTNTDPNPANHTPNDTVHPALAPLPDPVPLSFRRPSQLSPSWQKIFQTTLTPPATALNTDGFPLREI